MVVVVVVVVVGGGGVVVVVTIVPAGRVCGGIVVQHAEAWITVIYGSFRYSYLAVAFADFEAFVGHDHELVFYRSPCVIAAACCRMESA